MNRKEYLQNYRLTHKKEISDYRLKNIYKIRENNRRWRKTHKEEIKLKEQKNYLDNKEERLKSSKLQYQKMKEKVTKEVIKYYSSGTMACANPFNEHKEPYTNILALTLDHIEGGGHKHRNNIKRSGAHFYRYLQKQGYPDGYRVLCMNCQFMKFKTEDVKK